MAAVCLHLLFALFLFSPFFLAGGILVGSTDSLTVKLPMLFAGRDDFWSGSISFWDRFTNAGSSVALCSTCPGIYAPENWIYYLLPPAWGPSAMTLIYTLKYALVGIASYFLLIEEVRSRRWALFGSVMLVLSGRAIWAVTTHENLTALLAVLIALYLFWTAHRRSLGMTALLLTVDLIILAMSPTANAAAYWFLVITVFFLYRIATQKTRIPSATLFLLAASLSLPVVAFFLARLLPLLMDLQHLSQTGFQKIRWIDETRLALRLFVPEALGVHYSASRTITTLFQQGDMSIDGDSRDYYGWTVLLLIFFLLVLRTNTITKRLVFLVIFVAIAVALNYYLEPFETLARFVLGPLFHPSSIDHFMTLGVVFLAAHAGVIVTRQIRSRVSPFWNFSLLLVALFVILYVFCIWVMVWYLQHGLGEAVIITLPSLAASAVLITLAYRFRTFVFRWWWIFPFILAGITLPIAWILNGLSNQGYHFPDHTVVLGTSWLGLAAIILWLFSMSEKEHPIRAKKRSNTALGLAAIAVVFLIIPWRQDIGVSYDLWTAGRIALVGVAKFVSVLIVGVAVTVFYIKRRISARSFWMLLLALLVTEQLVALKVHSFRVMNPFSFADARLYTPRPPVKGIGGELLQMDLARYRVDGVAQLTGMPIVAQLYGTAEPLTNFARLYKLPSTSGIKQTISNRFLKLADTLEPGLTRHGARWYVGTRPKGQRFLDLTGVKYVQDPESGAVIERPTALARFMSFENWETLSVEEALRLISSPEFAPQNLAIVSRMPAELESINLSSRLNASFGIEALEDPVRAWYSDPEVALPQWIALTYSRPIRMNRITLAAQAVGASGDEHLRAPKDFVLQGSLDGEQWRDIVTAEGWQFGKNREPRSLSFNNEMEYRHYRLMILNNGNGGGLVTVNRFTLDYQPAPLNPSESSASVLDYQEELGDRITVEVNAEKPRLVLFNDTYHPGWKAWVDGVPARLENVNYAFMGVQVPKGAKRLTLSFEPVWRGWIGWLFSLATVLAVTVVALWTFALPRLASLSVGKITPMTFKSTAHSRKIAGVLVAVMLAVGLLRILVVPLG